MQGREVNHEQLFEGSTDEPDDAGHGNGISQDSD